jgi:hypothetical protein
MNQANQLPQPLPLPAAELPSSSPKTQNEDSLIAELRI